MFECVWLSDPSVPDELKPSNSNLIIVSGPAPVALPVHGQQVSKDHQVMYDEWLATRA
jgi:hypothetical protein